jgi:DNA-binding CsgD family transcriptional regulator
MNPPATEKQMHRLSPADYDRLLDCVRELHSFRDLPALRLWLITAALPRLIPSDWFSYNEVDLHSPQNTFTLLRPDAKVFKPLIPRFAELAHQHPIITRQLNQHDLAVRTIADFLSCNAYHRLELYNDVYRRLGVEHQIAAALESKRDFITAFVLSRQKHSYTERDRSVLEHLRVQLLVAIRNILAAEPAQAASGDHIRVLNHHRIATITINLQGHIVHHSVPALAWIGSPRSDRLPENILAWVGNRLSGAQDLNSQNASLRLAHADGEVLVQVVPSSTPNHTLLTLQLQPSRTPVRDLGEFGLSKREGEVAHWICEGKSNAGIAAILGISQRTVHKHVEHIFERLGVDSRVAVAIRFLAGSRLNTQHAPRSN